MSEQIPSSVAWNEFTPAQRRRAEALLLARLLFPGNTLGMSQAQAAAWVIYGRSKVQP